MVTRSLAVRYRSSLATAACTAAALLWLPSAQALTTGYSSAADYAGALAAAGLSGSTYGFPMASSGQIDPGSFTVGPAIFAGQNAGNGGSFLTHDDYGLAGNFYSHQLFEGMVLGIEQTNLVLIQFAAPIRAFAFSTDVWNFGGPPFGPAGWPTSGPTPMSLATSTGDLLDFTTPTSNGGLPVGSAPIGFSGLVSDTPFDSVLVSVTQGQNFQVTDFSVAAVPEPATPMLMLGGLMAVGAAVRQARRQPD